MKQTIFAAMLIFSCMVSALAQETAREKAEAIAKNDFSKSKHERKEKYGVVKEKRKVIESTPVMTTDLSLYEGHYGSHDSEYKIHIKKAADSWVANLQINNTRVELKNVTITDALFEAVKVNADGTEEKWEGVFINKNDDGNSEFGLGVKLSKPIQVAEGLTTTKIFLRKAPLEKL
jgi:hypothetical protein